MGRYTLAQDLRAGDFIQMGGPRFGASWSSEAEGFTRIDHVEHLAPDEDVLVTGWQARTRQPVAAVFAHGLPGVVLLRPGDHTTWPTPPERWRTHGAHHTWWSPPSTGTVFAGATLPPTSAAPDTTAPPKAATSPAVPQRRNGNRRRPTVYAKSAAALAVGDYLQILGCAEAQDTWDVDEGYAYVAWVAHVDPAVVRRVFADPAWRSGPVTGVAVHGISGLLLIPDRDVEVLVDPNRERAVFDRDQATSLDPAPRVLLAGMTLADPAEQLARDAATRPPAPPHEQDLYLSEFRDPRERRLHLDGVDGFRAVPLSELPWPGTLFKCAHAARAEQVRVTYPDDEAAHTPVWPAVNAELFAALTGTDFADCPYHRPDWTAIAPACVDAMAAGPDLADMCAALHADPRVPDGQHAWAEAVFTDPIGWDETSATFINGQHRSCALRAAGVAAVPVVGRHLPDRETPPLVDALGDAATRVAAFWRSEATARYGDNLLARTLAARAAAGSPLSRRLLRRACAGRKPK